MYSFSSQIPVDYNQNYRHDYTGHHKSTEDLPFDNPTSRSPNSSPQKVDTGPKIPRDYRVSTPTPLSKHHISHIHSRSQEPTEFDIESFLDFISPFPHKERVKLAIAVLKPWVPDCETKRRDRLDLSGIKKELEHCLKTKDDQEQAGFREHLRFSDQFSSSSSSSCPSKWAEFKAKLPSEAMRQCAEKVEERVSASSWSGSPEHSQQKYTFSWSSSDSPKRHSDDSFAPSTQPQPDHKNLSEAQKQISDINNCDRVPLTRSMVNDLCKDDIPYACPEINRLFEVVLNKLNRVNPTDLLSNLRSRVDKAYFRDKNGEFRPAFFKINALYTSIVRRDAGIEERYFNKKEPISYVLTTLEGMMNVCALGAHERQSIDNESISNLLSLIINEFGEMQKNLEQRIEKQKKLEWQIRKEKDLRKRLDLERKTQPVQKIEQTKTELNRTKMNLQNLMEAYSSCRNSTSFANQFMTRSCGFMERDIDEMTKANMAMKFAEICGFFKVEPQRMKEK